MSAMNTCFRILVLTYFATVSVRGSPWWLQKDVFPRDMKVFQGESLKIWCSNPSKARQRIKVTNATNGVRYINATDGDVSPQEGEVSTWLEITEDFFTPRTIVSCENVIDETFVYVEKPLENVTDITVEFSPDTDRLDISWLPGQLYLHPSEVETVVHWGAQVMPGASLTRTCDVISQTTCSIFLSGQSIVLVRLNVTLTEPYNRPPYLRSQAPTWASQDLVIKPFDYIKLSPPLEFRVVGANSSCVDLSWRGDLYFQVWPTSVYSLWIKRRGDQEFTLVVDGKKHNHSGDVVSVTLCDLQADSQYTFRLSVKPADRGLWSDGAETHGKTGGDSDDSQKPIKPTKGESLASQVAQLNRKLDTMTEAVQKLAVSVDEIRRARADCNLRANLGGNLKDMNSVISTISDNSVQFLKQSINKGP